MEKDEKNFIDLLYEADFLWLYMASLSSADTLVDLESCKRAMEYFERMKKDLPSSKLKDDKNVKKFLKDIELILKREMEIFEKVS